MPSLARPLLIIVACILLLPMAAPLLQGSPLPPYLSMDSPSSGDVISGDVIVEFTVDDAYDHQVDLYIDSVLIESSISSPHTIVGLADGMRYINLSAHNIHGLYTNVSALVTMDSTPPHVNIDSPSEGEVFEHRDIPFNWTVEDDSDVSMSYRVDGGEWVPVQGNITLDLEHDGNYTLTLRAIDIAHNEASSTVNFTVDTGMPVLRFTSPDMNSYHDVSNVTVNWTAYNYDHLNYSVDGGTWTTAPANGTVLTNLDNGRHTILLQGTNVNGTDIQSLSFYVNVPALTILSPMQDMRFGTNSIMVVWDVVNILSYHTDIVLNAEGITREYPGLETDSLRITNIPVGSVTLTLTVTDSMGNTLESNVSFMVGVKGLPLGAISISNDDSLKSLADQLGIPGSGIENDPFVFDKIGFDAQGAGHAIKVEHTSLHIVFSNLSLFNTELSWGVPSGTGLLLKDTKNIVVSDCVMVEHFHGVQSKSISHNLTISDNFLRDSYRGAVTVEQGYNLTITDNDCRDAGRWAIKAGWELTESKDINVSGNDCSGHGRYGIALERVNGGVVSHNKVTTHLTHDTTGIYLYNIATSTTISDNDCRFNNQGILLTGGAYSNTISQNDCRNNTYGIVIADQSERNTIAENDCSENPYGIYLYRGDYNIVRNNNCSQSNNSIGIGIYVQGGSSNLIQDNNVSGNLLGIHADRSSSQEMRGNDCRDAGEYAILISGIPYGHQIIDNDCRFATLDAIRMQSDNNHVSSNIIEGNDCRFNGGSGLNISTTAQYNVTFNTISNNDFRSSVYDMIRIEGGNYSHNSFTGNILSDAPMMPINLISSSLNYNNITVQGNQMQNSSSHAFLLYGNLTHIYVLNNLANNATLDGINVTDSLDGLRHIHIDGNDVCDSGGDGIYLRSNSFIRGGSVSGNIVLNIPLMPVQVISSTLEDFRIDGNDVSDHPTVYPIVVPATYLKDVSISGNDMRDCGGGIVLQDRIVENLTISGNDLRGNPGNLIEVTSSQEVYGLRVDENNLSRVGGKGILVVVDGLRNSTFDGNDLSLIFDEPLNIISPQITYVSVDRNFCPYASDNGLSIITSSIYSLSVSGNYLKGSGLDGLRLDALSVDILAVNNNTLDDAMRDGLTISSSSSLNHVRVENNSLVDVGRDSIVLTATEDIFVSWVVDNVCKAEHRPLVLSADRIIWSSIEGNQLVDANTRPLLLESDHLQQIYVRDNNARGSAGYGVEMNGTFVQDILISGNMLDGAALDGINVTTRSPDGLRNVNIRGNNVSGAGGHGIHLDGGSIVNGGSVSGNTAFNTAGIPVRVLSTALMSFDIDDNRLNGTSTRTVPLPLEVTAHRLEEVRISGNFLWQCGQGIVLHDRIFLNVTISHNLLNDTHGTLIELTSALEARGIKVNENNLTREGGKGIRVDVQGLVSSSFDKNKMYLIEDEPLTLITPYLMDVSVDGNSCPGAADNGLNISTTSITDLSVSGNDLNNSLGSGLRIVAESIEGLIINHNHIENVNGPGITVAADSLIQLTIHNNTASTLGISNDAISVITDNLQGLSHVYVYNNTVVATSGHGIYLSGNSLITDGNVSGNKVYDTSGTPIQVHASELSHFDICGNTVSDHPVPMLLNSAVFDTVNISANIIRNCGSGLVLEADSISDLIISYNDLSGSDNGIRVESTGTTERVLISFNDLDEVLSNAITLHSDEGLESIEIIGNHGSAEGFSITSPFIQHGNISDNELFCDLVIDTENAIVMGSIDSNFLSSISISSGTLDLKELSRNDIFAPSDDAIVIMTGRADIHSISGNNVSDCTGVVLLIDADRLTIERLDHNNVTFGIPKHFLSISANITDIGGMDHNIMDPTSSEEAVVLTSELHMNASMQHNILRGALNISSQEINLYMVNNTIGAVDIQGVQVKIPSVKDNRMLYMNVDAIDLIDLGVFELNDLGDLTLTSLNGTIIAKVIDNPRIGNMAITSLSNITIGNITDNDLDRLHIEAGGWVEIVAFEYNSLTSGGSTAVTITAGGNTTVISLSDNTIIMSNSTAVDINAKNVSLSRLADNVFQGNVTIHAAEDTWMESFIDNSLESLVVTSGNSTTIDEIGGNNHYLVQGSAMQIRSPSVMIGVIENNELQSGTPEHFLDIQGGAIDIRGNITNNLVHIPCSSESVIINGTGLISLADVHMNFFNGDFVINGTNDITLGDVYTNTISGDLEIISQGNIIIFGVDGNSLNGMYLDATGSMTIDNITLNTIDGGIYINSSGDISMGTVHDNNLHFIRIHAAESISISDVHENRFQTVNGDVISLNATDIIGSEVSNNTIQGGTPSRFLFVEADTASFTSVNNNTMIMGSDHEALLMVVATSLGIDFLNDNELNGNLTFISNSISIGAIDRNIIRNMHIDGGEVILHSVSENECNGTMVLEGSTISTIDAFNVNRMASLTIDTPGELIIRSFSDNVCSGSATVNGNLSLSIDITSSNELHTLELNTEGLMTLGQIDNYNVINKFNITAKYLDISGVEWNVIGNMTVTVDDYCNIGPIIGNTIDLLDIFSGDLTISSIDDNHGFGSLVIGCTHLKIENGITGNTFSKGIQVNAVSADNMAISNNNISSTGDGIRMSVDAGMAVTMQGNTLFDCGGNGIHLISGGTVVLDMNGDNISADLAALRVDAVNVNVVAEGITVAGGADGLMVDADDVLLQIENSSIESDGFGINLTGTSSLTVNDVDFTNNAVGISCLDNQDLSIYGGSQFIGNGVGINVAGGSVNINNSIFEANGIGILMENAGNIVFQGNAVTTSAGDGLRLVGCNAIDIRDNIFTNNGGFAINAIGCTAMTAVWNEFYDNNGATDYSIGNEQCHDDNGNTWSESRFPDSGGTEGNYWSDWQSPDDNNDGIVDIPYNMSGGGTDQHPLRETDDIYPPYVVITAPEDGSNHSYTTINLEWEAMDNRSGISQYDIEVLVDGVIIATLPSDTVSLEIDPTTLEEGNRTIIVSVRDNAGNYGNASITILIDRTPPEIIIKQPYPNEVLQTPFDLGWNVSDEYDSNPRVDISFDGENWILDITSPYEIDGLDDGLYTVYLRAVDHLNNINITSIVFTVDNTPPVVSITSPQEGEYFNSTAVMVTWTVVDDNDWNVELFVDGVYLESIGMDYSFEFSGLDDGERNLTVRVIDVAGNQNETSVKVIIDTVEPELQIDSPADEHLTNISTILVEWTAYDDSPLTFEISNDGEVWSLADTDDEHLFDLNEGKNTLWVRAVDEAGNVNTKSVEVTLDTFPPELEITSPDEGEYFNTDSVNVDWTVTDDSPFTVYISKNGIDWIAADTQYSHTYTGLAEGNNTLWVRAVDDAGNWNVTNVTVIVDLTLPQVNITSPADGSINGTGSVIVNWTVVEYNDWNAEVSVDGGAWTSIGMVYGYEFTGLDDGARTLSVMITDVAGNSNSTSITVTVDTKPPKITIDSPDDGYQTNSTTVLMEWTVTDLTDVTLNVSVDGGAWIATDTDDNHTFTLSEGTHILSLRAVDEAGNVNEKDITVTVDLTPPDVHIESPADGSLNGTGTVMMNWAVVEENEWDAEVSVDGGPWTLIGMVYGYEFTGLEDGSRTLSVKITDEAGNSNSTSITVTVDTVEPKLTIVSPLDGQITNSSTILVEWTVTDDTAVTMHISDDGSNWLPADNPNNHTFTIVEGENVLWLQATDELGHRNEKSVTVFLDTEPPDIEITSPEEGDYVNSTSVRVEWTVTDASPVTMSVSYDGENWEPSQDSNYHTFTGLDEGEAKLWLRAVDEVGNKREANITVIVDITEPELSITSPDDHHVTYDDTVLVEWTVDDDSPYTVTVSDDGIDWVQPDNAGNHTFTLVEGENELWVRAVDAAGNENISSVTVEYVIPEAAFLQKESGPSTEEYAAVAAGAAVLGGAYLLIRPRRL